PFLPVLEKREERFNPGDLIVWRALLGESGGFEQFFLWVGVAYVEVTGKVGEVVKTRGDIERHELTVGCRAEVRETGFHPFQDSHRGSFRAHVLGCAERTSPAADLRDRSFAGSVLCTDRDRSPRAWCPVRSPARARCAATAAAGQPRNPIRLCGRGVRGVRPVASGCTHDTCGVGTNNYETLLGATWPCRPPFIRNRTEYKTGAKGLKVR